MRKPENPLAIFMTISAFISRRQNSFSLKINAISWKINFNCILLRQSTTSTPSKYHKQQITNKKKQNKMIMN